jgi:hypothetical protein
MTGPADAGASPQASATANCCLRGGVTAGVLLEGLACAVAARAAARRDAQLALQLSKLAQPSRTAQAIWRSETRWQTQNNHAFILMRIIHICKPARKTP